jgi:hypothetical protein
MSLEYIDQKQYLNELTSHASASSAMLSLKTKIVFWVPLYLTEKLILLMSDEQTEKQKSQSRRK